tara:strand:+ start:429 stop:761 length:333 start_codon:yes stop_codon:yes gene_type:complete
VAHIQRKKRLLKRYGLKAVNRPKMTPSHKTKKAMVLAESGHQLKLIRFGAKGMGHNYSAGARRAFKARHRRNIARGKMSAAYWADKFLWSAGGRKKNPPKSQKQVYGRKK